MTNLYELLMGNLERFFWDTVYIIHQRSWHLLVKYVMKNRNKSLLLPYTNTTTIIHYTAKLDCNMFDKIFVFEFMNFAVSW